MKHFCTQCGMISSYTTEWCPNRDCSPGTLTLMFEQGDLINDIMIQQHISILPTSILYRAEHNGEPLLIKVGHKGCQEFIRHESKLLEKMREMGVHPAFPTLRNTRQGRYGKYALHGQLKYYITYENINGRSLRDMLIQNPQPLEQLAAWYVIGLADGIAYLHLKLNHVLLHLTPESVLVHQAEDDEVLRPIIMDMALAAPVNKALTRMDYAETNYLSPEQVQQKPGSPATDVYGLGLILYEMLAGKPAIPAPRELGKKANLDRVLTHQPTPLYQVRPDIHQDVSASLFKALHKSPAERHKDIRTFAKELRTTFGEVPKYEPKRRVDRRVVIVGVFIIMAFLLIFITMIVLQG